MEEELNRMREHVFKEVDKDKDGLISRKEFLDMAHSDNFDQDEGWKGLDEEQVYTQEELQRFMQMREHEMQMQIVGFINDRFVSSGFRTSLSVWLFIGRYFEHIAIRE